MKISSGTRKFKTKLCIALAVFFNVTAKAQDNTVSTDSIYLSLDQIIEIALCDNPTIKVAEREIELKKYTKLETISGLLPNISASGAVQNSLELQKMKIDFPP